MKAKVRFTSQIRFNGIVEWIGENVSGVRKCVNARAFNHKSGLVGNKFMSTSHSEFTTHA